MKCSNYAFRNKELNVKRHNYNYYMYTQNNKCHCIGGVIVSVLASNAVDRGFDPRSGQSKDYKIKICCLSTKHAALTRKSKDWLARNQDNEAIYLSTDCCFSEQAL